MKEKAIVLLSGGLDSTTCLAYAQHQGYACYALSFDYGQRNNAELIAAKNNAKHFGVKEHEIITLALNRLCHSSLTNKEQSIPNFSKENNGSSIPSTYVPARNTILLSLALGWAESLAAGNIFIGVSAIDYSGYPDCRPEYIEAFTNMANLATKRGIEGQDIQIHTPLIHLSKADTIKLGISLGVDYAKTISCYQASSTGKACGQCDSCILRKNGFKDANIPDPTLYD